MNNKGIVKEETLKIIIAVVSILILVYLAASLYKMYYGTKEKDQALAVLTQVVDKVNSLETDDDITITGPRQWVMYVLFEKNICVAKCLNFNDDLQCLAEEPDTQRCAPVKSELNVQVSGEELLIYIVDLKLEKQNGMVTISKK